MQKTIRTFVAVEISPDVRTRAAQLIARLGSAPAKVRWVQPDKLHLTLKFLGQIDAREVPVVCNALAQGVAGLPPFEFEARGAGAFPDRNRPRTVWLGVSRGADELIALHAAVEDSLAELGFRRDERRFLPHLTLGRVRSGSPGTADLGQLIGESSDFAGGVVSVDEVVVFSSQLGREGPTYEPLSTAPLART